MVPRTLIDYTSTTDRIVRVFGKRKVVGRLGPDDFAKLRADIAKRRGPVALARVSYLWSAESRNRRWEGELRRGGCIP